MPSASSPRDVNLVDGLSLYEAGDRVRQLFSVDKAPLNYTVLHRLLSELREEHGFRPAQHSSLPISYDPKSDAQNRFLSAIGRTPFEPDPVDYRDLYVSLPPGTTPKDSDDRPIASFASRISYVLGRLSRHSDPHIIVVTHSYEMLWPLQNIMIHNPAARIGICYFEKLMDFRWQYAHIDDADSEVAFFPLDKHMPELFGLKQKEVLDASESRALDRTDVSGLNQY